MTRICFYETSKPYGCFSNFSKHHVEIDDRVWPTSEHYFQAAKFTDLSDRDAIHAAATPFMAAQLGRDRKRSFRKDWDDVRDEVMLRVLRAKFTQNVVPRNILASTNGAELIEHTTNDRYWGDGGDGSGTNRLGQLLEQVRSELVNDNTPAFIAPPWIAYPDVEPSDLFWRMGSGEDYITEASLFKIKLLPEARADYDAYFPVPDEWRLSW
jgi:N-glycosidase YbiA